MKQALLKRWLIVLLISVSSVLSQFALAHSSSNSFLLLTAKDNALIGALRLRVQDIVWLADFDRNRDLQLSWQELQQGQPVLQAVIAKQLVFYNATADLATPVAVNQQQPAQAAVCALQLQALRLEQLNTGLFVELPLQVSCASTIQQLHIHNDLLFATDTAHRSMLNLQQGANTFTAVFSPEQREQQLLLTPAGTSLDLLAMLQEGVWHIWTGYDHLLFLLALLLPLFVRKAKQQWLLPAARAVATQVLWTVSAFTVAHSLTLLLASVTQVQIDSKAVELVIAASVALSGVNVLTPIFSQHHLPVAFGFGLIHGFGFAGALRDLSLTPAAFLQSLLSFNVGVELGQLAIVAAVFPLLLYLRCKRYYQTLLQPFLALAIVCCGVLWVLERSIASS